MDEIKIELALEIMQLKIVHYIKDYKGEDKEKFKRELKDLIDEREKIYELDTDTIDKVYNVYVEEIKRYKNKI
nr:hypothetical protein [Clostridia bacterium]